MNSESKSRLVNVLLPAVVVVLLLWFLAFLITPNHIVFEDALLEAHVRQMIDKPQGNLRPQDVASIDTLIVRDARVERLGGIEYLSNLKVLDLRGNRIKSLEPLSKLTKLVQINLRENDIDTIEPLRKLTNLQYVNLRDNNITDISPLANLAKLEDLNIRYNRVEQLDALANLQNLKKRLYFEGNPISTLEPIAHYVNEIADKDQLIRE